MLAFALFYCCLRGGVSFVILFVVMRCLLYTCLLFGLFWVCWFMIAVVHYLLGFFVEGC